MYNIELNKEFTLDATVGKSDTANEIGSGFVDVYSTAVMIGLMEETAATMLQAMLDEADTSVGIRLEIDHIAATPVGMQVKCCAKIIKVEKRIITFEIEAFDEVELIGKGIHKRCIVNKEKFEAKAQTKLNK